MQNNYNDFVMEQRNKTLGEFIIENQNAFQYSSGELSRIINSIRLAAKVVNYKVNKAGLVDIVGAAGEQNIQGEDQQKLDVYANEVFIQTLINREIVCGIASEENDDFITVQGSDNSHNNKYIVLMDPLDGSSNIDVNVSVGTIFSVFRRVTPVGTPVTLEDFLQPGINQVAAGYVIYGTSTMLVYTTGHGVNGFTLNPAIGTFYLSHPNMKFSKDGTIYSAGHFLKRDRHRDVIREPRLITLNQRIDRTFDYCGIRIRSNRGIEQRINHQGFCWAATEAPDAPKHTSG